LPAGVSRGAIDVLGEQQDESGGQQQTLDSRMNPDQVNANCATGQPGKDGKDKAAVLNEQADQLTPDC
jgi:hypothetical protein